MAILKYSYFFRAGSNTHVIAFKKENTQKQGEDINAIHITDSCRKSDIEDFIGQLQYICIEKGKTFTAEELKDLWLIFPKKLDCTLD